MKIFRITTLLLALAGCQTPQGIVDTASLVAKISTQMNGEFTDYVSKQNVVRDEDVTRLAEMYARTDRLAAANQDQFDILRLASDDETNRVLDGIKASRIEEPGIGDKASVVIYSKALQTEFGKNSFDDGPLKSVSSAAGSIAAPGDIKGQIISLGTFANQVYDDMKKSNAEKSGK